MSLRWIAVFALVFVPSARAQAYSSAHAPIFMPLDLEIPDSPKAAGIFFVGALLMLVGAYLLLTMKLPEGDCGSGALLLGMLLAITGIACLLCAGRAMWNHL